MAKPARDPLYLKFVRSLPCAVCSSDRGIEAAHVGAHGLGQKASDRSTIPLCPRHHRTGAESLHTLGPRRFEQVHGVQLAEIVRRLNAKPQLKIEGGRYWADIGDDRYLIGDVRIGPSRALHHARNVWREVYLLEAS